MRRFLAITVFVTVAVCGANVHAQQGTGTQGTGLYFGGHLGLNILSDPDIEQAGVVSSTSYDPGVSLGGVLGYDFGMVRLDGELALRANGISDINGIPVEGHTSAFSYMVNGYFDFPTGGPMKPYIGGGIGLATVLVNHEIFGFTIADDSDSVVAYQFSGGIGYEINPRTTVTFGYRYFATEDAEMEDASGSPFTTGYQSHEFNIGARLLFN